MECILSATSFNSRATSASVSRIKYDCWLNPWQTTFRSIRCWYLERRWWIPLSSLGWGERSKSFEEGRSSSLYKWQCSVRSFRIKHWLRLFMHAQLRGIERNSLGFTLSTWTKKRLGWSRATVPHTVHVISFCPVTNDICWYTVPSIVIMLIFEFILFFEEKKSFCGSKKVHFCCNSVNSSHLVILRCPRHISKRR